MITLNEDKNVYTLAGQEYDRVSTILQSVGIIDPRWYTEEGAMRGTYVHEACALYDKGDLHWDSLDPKIEKYVKAWVRFREDSNGRFKNVYIEKTLFSKFYGVAGTCDRLEIEGDRPALIDIKSGDSNFAGIQTAAYESMFDSLEDSLFTKKPNRYVVKLNDNGTYKLIPKKEISDKVVWQSALNVYRFNHPRRV